MKVFIAVDIGDSEVVGVAFVKEKAISEAVKKLENKTPWLKNVDRYEFNEETGEVLVFVKDEEGPYGWDLSVEEHEVIEQND